MNFFVPIMMFGWIPIVIILFFVLPPRRAVIASFLFAWMFLPMASYHIPGIPAYTKMSAACCGIFAGAAIFDNKRMLSFRPRLFDIPMIIWCLCPFVSAIVNDLGAYDGLSAIFVKTTTWGLPYIIGRLYFNDLEGLKEFAIGIFIGGLLYIPLCLYEIRMSPQLHYKFYGFFQHSFNQTIRAGGYRPMVFMDHGLMVGMWMASASFIGICLWISGAVKKIFNIPMTWLVSPLIFTSILCKSIGATILLILGIGIFYTTKKFQTKIPILLLLLIPAVYLPARATGAWNGYNLTEYINDNFSQERAESLYTRFYNENALCNKAMEKPVFGWGRWGRSRITDSNGKDTSITDSVWIIAFGESGLVGVFSLTLSILFPAILYLRVYPAGGLFKPESTAASALAILLGIYMVDNLLNAMTNPIFIVTAGGVISLALKPITRCKQVMEPHTENWDCSIYRPRFI